ncbi:hypothetical protein LEP1GSC061_3999 [Leptospira wolffii serovar Khorat str. Khorat-H2]|nr:hypothetical protein LEP1GSC061_3999 [Leptospira wolffii serovar Khorat str. Khorat-H2]
MELNSLREKDMFLQNFFRKTGRQAECGRNILCNCIPS